MADILQVEESNRELHNEQDTEQKPEASPEESKDETEDVKSNEDDEFTFQSFSAESTLALEDLANSLFIHNRQLAAKKILDYFQRAGSNREELQAVISVMCKLSEDDETMVRTELVQQIPSIALFCQNHSSDLKIVIRQQLVPYTVKLMNDSHFSVYKLGQSTLLLLLENNLVEQNQLSEWICPYVSQLVMCNTNVEELRVEDVRLMCKMIPQVSREITMKYFLEPFVMLCCDPIITIRKVCASGLGTLCKIAGTESTELSLLPAFLNLCNDDVWGVRLVCAQVFVDIAITVTSQTKTNVLPHIFINLLNDTTSYVRNAAYESLGGFIHTFAVPTKTDSAYESSTECMRKDSLTCRFSTRNSEINEHSIVRHRTSYPVFRTESSSDPSLGVVAKDGHVYLHVDNENSFNNFQYWRSPLPDIELVPEIELNIDIGEGGATNIHVRASMQGKEMQTCASEINVRIAREETTSECPKDSKLSKMQVQAACINTYSHSEGEMALEDDAHVFKSFKEAVLTFKDDDLSETSESVSNTFPKLEEKSSTQLATKYIQTAFDQSIVPPELLLRFITAVIPEHPTYDLSGGKQDEDSRLGYCAYSFPAVAYTLGRNHWPCIRNVCNTLARSMKWTIRSTIAASLHELAVILGDEITVSDLLPVFLDLLKDVDEVRLKIAQHLPAFLSHLGRNERKRFLPLIEDFTKVDNEKNWRFRCTVAKQLRPTLELYMTFDVYMYFMPIALSLVKDKVATVRRAAVELMAALVKKFSEDENNDSLSNTLLSILDSSLRQVDKWIWRQTYVLLCEQLAKQKSLSPEAYAEEIVPQLFTLAFDVVPNVRMAVSRCLALTLLPLDYLSSIQSARQHLLVQVMYSLQRDVDDDVRYYAELAAKDLNEVPERVHCPLNQVL